MAIRQIGMGQQDLGSLNAMLAALGGISIDQSHLADTGRGLQFMNFMGPPLPAQTLHPGSNRTGCDQYDFLALPAQFSYFSTQPANAVDIQSLTKPGQQGATDFDNP